MTDSSLVTAHCANSGAMPGLNAPGNRILLSAATNLARKPAFS